MKHRKAGEREFSTSYLVATGFDLKAVAFWLCFDAVPFRIRRTSTGRSM